SQHEAGEHQEDAELVAVVERRLEARRMGRGQEGEDGLDARGDQDGSQVELRVAERCDGRRDEHDDGDEAEIAEQRCRRRPDRDGVPDVGEQPVPHEDREDDQDGGESPHDDPPTQRERDDRGRVDDRLDGVADGAGRHGRVEVGVRHERQDEDRRRNEMADPDGRPAGQRARHRSYERRTVDPWSSTPPTERSTSSIMRTTSSPTSADDRGSFPVRTAAQKSRSSSASGSAASTRGETMSPVRYDSRYSPNVCGSRSVTPESKTRTGSLLVSS